MPKGRSTSQTRHATLDGYAQASHQRCAWRTLRRCLASTHLRALWSSACTCGVSLPSATSSKLLMHRSTPLVEKPRRESCFLPSRCGLPPHRYPAPYFEKQLTRFTKGDLILNPQTLAGVRAAHCARASRSSEFSVSSLGCNLPLPCHGRDCILDIASALIGLDALRLRRQLWSATFAPESHELCERT